MLKNACCRARTPSRQTLTPVARRWPKAVKPRKTWKSRASPPTAAVGSGTGVGRFFETQSSKGGRYTVTLPDGTKVEEVNKVTAAQMVPFDNIQFTGNYGNMTEISYQTAKRAAKKGAKYYHITRQWQERGGNITISADLYK